MELKYFSSRAAVYQNLTSDDETASFININVDTNINEKSISSKLLRKYM